MLSPSLFWGKRREPKAWVIGGETRRRVSGIVRWSWRFEFASESETKLQLWGDDPLCNNQRQKGNRLIDFNCPLTGGSLILAGRISLIFFSPSCLETAFPSSLTDHTLPHNLSPLRLCTPLWSSDYCSFPRSLSPSYCCCVSSRLASHSPLIFFLPSPTCLLASSALPDFFFFFGHLCAQPGFWQFLVFWFCFLQAHMCRQT